VPTQDQLYAYKLRLIVNELAELPLVRHFAKPIYRRRFQQRSVDDISYFGAFDSFTQALAQVPPTVASSYDIEAAKHWYRERHDRIRVSDYPVVYWLSQLFASGQHWLFDLGGHTGVSYYGFRHYLKYPDRLRWVIHDTPAAMSAGREWATEHDPHGQLAFADSPEDADAQQILLTCGALQYLDYTLPELLARLATPPAHVLINLVPMHPGKAYVTLQNMGVAICPYRVMAVPAFVADMKALGYDMIDHWQSRERNLRVPFEPACTIGSYHGFYFRRDASGLAGKPQAG
jgi:putative methyltransferase (TIGR04325 family)